MVIEKNREGISPQFPLVEITSPDNKPFPIYAYINGEKLQKCTHIEYSVDVDFCIPTFTFTTMGIPRIKTSGKIEFRYTPETIEEACRILLKSGKEGEDMLNKMREELS